MTLTVEAAEVLAAASLMESATRLRATADRLVRQAESIEAEVQTMGRGPTRQLLKGAPIIDKLTELIPAGLEFHYTHADRLLRAAGWTLRGVNATNTLLANLNRSDRVENLGNRTGMYRIREAQS